MFARLSAFLVWALLAACLVFWSLQLLSEPLHASAQPVAAAPLPQVGLERLFGAEPQVAAAAPEQQRFVLLGVVSPRAVAQRSSEGLALISVDGQPRTVRLGGVVDGDLRLVGVEPRSVHLGHGDATEMTLQLPDAASSTVVPNVPQNPGVPVAIPPGAPVVPQMMPAPLATPQILQQGAPTAPNGVTPG